jgi:hypothetical protein
VGLKKENNMAFNRSGFVRLVGNAGEETNKCFYKTKDLLSVVMGAGYFNNVAPDSLKAGDIIECAIDTDGNLFYQTLIVSSVTSGVVVVVGSAKELTVSGAVTPGVESVELNHATVAVAATIANSLGHPGLFVVKNTSASGTAAHSLTLTVGTFDGTNNKAVLNAPNEALAVYFDSGGDGTILENVGSVALSSV